jgi:ACS family tartrate transporter-like MFS transporter
MTRNPYLELVAISISFAGISSALGPFWAIPNVFLGGAAAAGGIALINSLGNLGGFVGPTLMGYMKQTTGGFAGGLTLLALGIAGAASLSMLVPRSSNS